VILLPRLLGDGGLDRGKATDNSKAEQKREKGSERRHLDKTSRYLMRMCFSQRLSDPEREREKALEPKLLDILTRLKCC
jgi:hypothetical protein